MAKNVFVLGAGASMHTGAPQMSDFLDKARDVYFNGLCGEYYKPFFEIVFSAQASLQAAHSKSSLEIDNIESLFSAFEMAKLLKSFPGNNTSINNIINSTKKLIIHTLENTTLFNYAPQKSAVFPSHTYAEFIRLINFIGTDDVAIITFNYDIALDFAVIRTDNYFPSYSINTQGYGPRKPIKVYKLHGSLNWCRHDRKIFSLDDFQFTFEGSHPVIANIDKYIAQRLNIQRSKVNQLIVPPVWNKSKDYNALAPVWIAATKELENAENIFVIGYSMPDTDSFFKYLYSLGTISNIPIRRFHVFNPDISNIDNRFRKILGPGAEKRYKSYESTFNQAISIIKDILSVKLPIGNKSPYIENPDILPR